MSKPTYEALPHTPCSPISDFEKGPWSYDLYADGLEPVALLNNPNHTQGEWVSIDEYRKIERENTILRDALKSALLRCNHGHDEEQDHCLCWQCEDDRKALDSKANTPAQEGESQ